MAILIAKFTQLVTKNVKCLEHVMLALKAQKKVRA
jgi:hypothetical protein